MHITPEVIDTYCRQYTSPASALLESLEDLTTREVPNARMLSGRLEGRFLNMLVQLSGAKTILEIGMFTGYSALSMAEALPEDGVLHTIDNDETVARIARDFISRSPHGHKIHIHMGEALQIIDQLHSQVPYNWDLVFLDADKENYPAYFNAFSPQLNDGALLVVDNALWSGNVLTPKAETDIGIHQLNEQIRAHPDFDNLLLPIRDGIHIAKKRSFSNR